MKHLHFTQSLEPLEGGGLWLPARVALHCGKCRRKVSLQSSAPRTAADRNTWLKTAVNFAGSNLISFISPPKCSARRPVWLATRMWSTATGFMSAPISFLAAKAG